MAASFTFSKLLETFFYFADSSATITTIQSTAWFHKYNGAKEEQITYKTIKVLSSNIADMMI